MRTVRYPQPSKIQSGGIILLSGLSGVGKSTLIQDALTDFPEKLKYLKDYTTRQKRITDTDIEYTFVDSVEFDLQSALAEAWQEGSVYGNRYGHDTAAYKKLIRLGGYFIGCCYPSVEDAQSLEEYYNPSYITLVHIDLPTEIRAERLITQRGEEAYARLEEDKDWTMSEEYQDRVNYVFKSDKNRDENRLAFNELLRKIFLNSGDKQF